MARELSMIVALAALLALSSWASAGPRGGLRGGWHGEPDGSARRHGYDWDEGDGRRSGDVYVGVPWSGGNWNDCCQRQPIPHRQGLYRGLWYY